MFGVAPAFFFSLYSTEFTADDYIAGLRKLSELGFTRYQAEIFFEENISEWESKAAEVKHAADTYGLSISQMDAHFMINFCDSEKSLYSEREMPLLEKAVEVCKTLGTDVITIPIGKFNTNDAAASSRTYGLLWDQFVRKIKEYCHIAFENGMKVGMEIVPGSILSNTDGLLRLIEETGCSNLGYNFDTGHAWASKEIIEFIPEKLKNRIWGTHLKDNFSYEDLIPRTY